MIAQDAHRVVLRDRNRPEKCRAGVQTRVSSPIGCSAFQSSSTIRSAGMPHSRRCAPTPERHDERRALGAGQRPHGVHVEVVVVVVADHHGVQGGQRLQRQRRRVQPLRADRAATASSARSTPGRSAPGSRRSPAARWRGRASVTASGSAAGRRRRRRPAGSVGLRTAGRAARRTSRTGPAGSPRRRGCSADDGSRLWNTPSR